MRLRSKCTEWGSEKREITRIIFVCLDSLRTLLFVFACFPAEFTKHQRTTSFPFFLSEFYSTFSHCWLSQLYEARTWPFLSKHLFTSVRSCVCFLFHISLSHHISDKPVGLDFLKQLFVVCADLKEWVNMSTMWLTVGIQIISGDRWNTVTLYSPHLIKEN